MTHYARQIVAVGLVTLCAAVAVNAQSSDTVADVPFAFSVGSEVLPRDTYTISRMHGQSGVFMIKGQRHGVVVFSQPDGRSDTDNGARLLFSRYGDRHFLREVRLTGSDGFSLPKSKAEGDAAEGIAGATPEMIELRTRAD